MDIDTDDDVLRALAEGKEMDYEQWPGLYSRILPRLEKIVQTSFSSSTPPRPPSTTLLSSPLPSQTTIPETSSPSSTPSSTNKENAPPPTSTSSLALPKDLTLLLQSITSTLSTHFTQYPPHTIQRLAELLLNPTQHYRKLSSYLHALDRVVHVTSTANTFPLPPAIPEPSARSVLSNGTSALEPVSWTRPTNSVQATLGTDESLGGALLTPIPWLLNGNNGNINRSDSLSPEVKTESTVMVEGPNGPGGIETVSVSINGISSTTSPSTLSPSPSTNDFDISASLRAEGAVTQGELLRQEQQAGVVPANQLTRTNEGTDAEAEEEEEIPHARGPEEIGMEDMGPQAVGGGGSTRLEGGVQGIDVEAAVGRKLSPELEDGVKEEEGEDKEDVMVEAKNDAREGTPKREADEEMRGVEKRVKSEPPEIENKDGEGDVKMEGDDGAVKTKEEPKVEEKEEVKEEVKEEEI